MRILFACGGTAGHINPALAVAGLLRARHSHAEVLFVGADGGMECDLVPRAGYRIQTVSIRSLRHRLTPAALWYNLKVLGGLAGSLRAAGHILDEFKPDAVLGTGGYASFPVVYTASRRGIPSAVHESNALPGLTTKLLARRADRVLVSFPEAVSAYRRPDRVTVTGTPVRQAFLEADRGAARRALGLDERPVVLSYFGSLGARDMNRHMVDFIRRESETGAFQHFHVTGRFGWAWMPDAVRQAGVDLASHPEIRLSEYLHDMPTAMAAADLLITRAGASTLAELMATGKPAILVPSPNVTGHHQEENARVLARAGAAVLLPESECGDGALFSAASGLLRENAKREAISARLRGLAVLDATEKIYQIVTSLAAKRGVHSQNGKI
ncbi:MAG: UDP-N-acetylglucosamine--N-acetylmuramyl-(pentapeptide) pyrophosphoryl-undecaprenol N-acetylglucosamine transferase [Oscillospiraceae bacterium]|jgi:UDP-N-acetylglucosamine--N-acetylmuramyl-(pentapeptide) pyrophosphoryl-undecaprenol N-acetylglucosamine transferase|nr:UDP-N-acetylglucosamine--N-acetylmuramyl-(pentapeptide) pyrophosphoryl-undecaprenol N-acetylglucosamine transferase [Oscillospiraceae bacterium]